MTQTGVRSGLLLMVFGLFLVLRTVNQDASGRTLIDHIIGKKTPPPTSSSTPGTAPASGPANIPGARPGSAHPSNLPGARGVGQAVNLGAQHAAAAQQGYQTFLQSQAQQQASLNQWLIANGF